MTRTERVPDELRRELATSQIPRKKIPLNLGMKDYSSVALSVRNQVSENWFVSDWYDHLLDGVESPTPRAC